MIEQSREQSRGFRLIKKLLQPKLKHQGVGRRFGANGEQKGRGLALDFFHPAAFIVKRPHDEGQSYRRASGEPRPAMDKEWLPGGQIGEPENFPEMSAGWYREPVILPGANHVVKDHRMDLLETALVDSGSLRFPDGNEVPETGIRLGPRGQVGLGANGEVGLEAIEEHGRRGKVSHTGEGHPILPRLARFPKGVIGMLGVIVSPEILSFVRPNHG